MAESASISAMLVDVTAIRHNDKGKGREQTVKEGSKGSTWDQVPFPWGKCLKVRNPRVGIREGGGWDKEWGTKTDSLASIERGKGAEVRSGAGPVGRG